MSRFVVAISVVAATAHAEPARADAAGRTRHRLVHAGVIMGGGLLYVSSEVLFKERLAPTTCRWCDPPHVDASVRDALRWSNPSVAARISDGAAFVVAPVAGLGLVMLGSNGRVDQTDRWIDDTLPILESAVLAGLINQTVKFGAGRQRPFVHYGDPARPHETDDNLSFYSGHTTLTFAIATSAGVVAHERGYRIEPVIWGAGYMLAVTAGYLRIAADKHYVTDVAVGAVAGVGIGLAVPLLFHRGVLAERGIVVTPTSNGITATGTF